MIVNPLIGDNTETPLTRAHRLYGTAPDSFSRVVTVNRHTLEYICSSTISGGLFESSGLPESLVSDNSLVSIAFSDSVIQAPLILDRVQIGT